MSLALLGVLSGLEARWADLRTLSDAPSEGVPCHHVAGRHDPSRDRQKQIEEKQNGHKRRER